MRRFWPAHRLSVLSALIVTAALSLAAQGMVVGHGHGEQRLGRGSSARTSPRRGRPPARRGAAQGGRRARLQRLQPDPAIGQADMMCADPRAPMDGAVSRITGTTSGTTSRRSGSCPAVPARAATVPGSSGCREDPSGPADGRHTRQRRHPQLRAVGRALDLDDLCDPNSDPQLPCTPRSDANAPRGSYPGGGAAFMELQFYPPGLRPVPRLDQLRQHALVLGAHHRQLECTATDRALQRQLHRARELRLHPDQRRPHRAAQPAAVQQPATFTPNSHTLLMNPGDKIAIHMFDAKVPGGHALEATERDHTTGRERHDDRVGRERLHEHELADCSGTRFNFQPEYIDRAGRRTSSRGASGRT